ncbi:hypothetical protein H6G97_36965 [Nostoc flagelliforme FACHB-838]|uniref:Uncharacterized protein n=1 Tax=Nostoc flagelliforme FACHB-838 TaxID=2692904 RepID=A0ABR8E0X4_9NOSO|nr:hypothetical protein [Nostoc flagelliforme]MBD2534761.1 hypothetical protein [Nostoc flagelliforme FACHB-838]
MGKSNNGNWKQETLRVAYFPVGVRASRRQALTQRSPSVISAIQHSRSPTVALPCLYKSDGCASAPGLTPQLCSDWIA